MRINSRYLQTIRMQEWFVIFRSYEGRSRFMKALLRPHFGHVSVIKRCGNLLIVVDPLLSRVGVDVIRPVSISQIFMELPEDMQVLRIALPVPERLLASHFANYFPTCVTCVKALLGICSWSMTPYGLYQELLRMGASKVKTTTTTSRR